MHGGLGVALVVAEALGEGFDGCFGGIVGRVAWGVGDALLGAGEDDGGGSRGGEERQEGGEAVGCAEEVGGEYLVVKPYKLCSIQSERIETPSQFGTERESGYSTYLLKILRLRPRPLSTNPSI